MTFSAKEDRPMSAASRIVFVEHNRDSLQFRAIFAVSFVFYLAAAVGHRLTPNHWSTARGRRSIFAEAWEASGTTARMAFAG